MRALSPNARMQWRNTCASFVLALVALMTIGLPAHADMRTMTLKGHRFYFDIPDGYVEEAQQPEYAEHSKKFKSPSTGTGIYFSVVSGRTLQQQMDFYDTKFQRDYLFDGRVGRAMSVGSDHQYLFFRPFSLRRVRAHALLRSSSAARKEILRTNLLTSIKHGLFSTATQTSSDGAVSKETDRSSETASYSAT